MPQKRGSLKRACKLDHFALGIASLSGRAGGLMIFPPCFSLPEGSSHTLPDLASLRASLQQWGDYNPICPVTAAAHRFEVKVARMPFCLKWIWERRNKISSGHKIVMCATS